MNTDVDYPLTSVDLRRVNERQSALEELLREALERHRDLSRAVDTQAETIRAQGEKIIALEAACRAGFRS